MELSWTAESAPARWDEDKARIVGAEAPGVFDSRYADATLGAVVPGKWWRALEGDQVVGFGWMDVSWGDAEILLATAREARGRGVGSFVLEQLKQEAHERGLNYLTNVVRATHPERERITQWLEKRGFASGEDGRHFRSVCRKSA